MAIVLFMLLTEWFLYVIIFTYFILAGFKVVISQSHGQRAFVARETCVHQG